MSELSLYELEMERGELLPARETLQVSQLFGINTNLNVATPTAIALGGNALLGSGGDATAAALNVQHTHIG